MPRTGVDALSRQWLSSGQRLALRCAGLSDEEMLWEPVADTWNLYPDSEHPGGWSYHYDFDPPQPHPVTTIGWRLNHITAGNWIYMEHSFGPAQRHFPDLAVDGTADEMLRNWPASREAVTDWLQAADDDDLNESRPSHLGGPLAAGEVIRILIDEQTHHGAEIALLRDLYQRQSTPAPLTEAG